MSRHADYYVRRTQRKEAELTRVSGRDTTEGRRLLAKLRCSQDSVKKAERHRDQLVREALDYGVGVRAVAEAVGVDKATVSRRYGKASR